MLNQQGPVEGYVPLVGNNRTTRKCMLSGTVSALLIVGSFVVYAALTNYTPQPTYGIQEATNDETPVPVADAGVVCDDTYTCPSDSTCCATPDGAWGCCPSVSATCCDDHIHCCPQEYPVCDATHSQCVAHNNDAISFDDTMRQVLATEINESESANTVTVGNLEDVECDPTHACPTGSTCCRSLSGEWNCCPSMSATCCSDHLHCCPREYPVCDMAHDQCLSQSNDAIAFDETMTRVAATVTTTMTVVESPVTNADVECDETHACPVGSTCCVSSSGGWNCCPSESATCCDDHVHCCPQEYPVCDTAHGQCLDASNEITGISFEDSMTRVAAIVKHD
eukprot:GFYU01008641.1.p1 GENE.GFYU01008641.1~~GFYU01008641.1.p1  ORF type:complete len:338 (+),score=79.07 GFYU01008641.1:138-1151(+)